MVFIRKLYFLVSFMIMSLFGTLAYPANLTISPIIVQLQPEETATTLTLKNSGDRPAAIQIRVFSWDIVDGREAQLPTNDLIASPPTITIRPKQEYVVRIIRISSQPVEKEESYRLLIDELPGPPLKSGAFIQLLVRHSVPVFVHGPQAGDPDVRWSIISKGKKSFLQAENVGHRYAKVFNVSLITSSGKKVAHAKKFAGYVLSGGKQIWPISNVPAKESLIVRGDSTIGKFEASVSADTP